LWVRNGRVRSDFGRLDTLLWDIMEFPIIMKWRCGYSLFHQSTTQSPETNFQGTDAYSIPFITNLRKLMFSYFGQISLVSLFVPDTLTIQIKGK